MDLIKKVKEAVSGVIEEPEHLDYTKVADREKWQKEMEKAGVEFLD